MESKRVCLKLVSGSEIWHLISNPLPKASAFANDKLIEFETLELSLKAIMLKERESPGMCLKHIKRVFIVAHSSRQAAFTPPSLSLAEKSPSPKS